METELKRLVADIKDAQGVLKKIQFLLERFSQEKAVIRELNNEGLEKGLELYRDESGFILFAYSESEGKYRGPHNHGDGQVIYTVVTGEVEMGRFARAGRETVVLKDMERLQEGSGRIYEVGEIHDTRCLSHKSVILRFTSCDLKIEEQEGRMLRFKVEGEE